jgi:soluble lytic murein transglycosylase-like protein
MTRQQTLWALAGGSLLLYLLYNRQQVGALAESGVDTMTAALTGWPSVQQGPKWMPTLNSFEDIYLIPRNLLARIAYQESHFRPDIISGATVSSAGALGMMQMMPQYFQSVNVPRPFTDADTTAQIEEAARLLSGLFSHFQDWGLAVAAYNAGQGTIDKYVSGAHTLPGETSTYVAQVIRDVPVATGLVVA